MKIVGAIARYLLGAAFLFFGSNLLFNFLKGQLPPGRGRHLLVYWWPTTTRTSLGP